MLKSIYVLLLLLAADLYVASHANASTLENGRNLNGVSLNGRNLNGRNLNGVSFNGLKLDGSDHDGTASGKAGETTIFILKDGERVNLR